MSQPSAEPAISVGTLHPTVPERHLHGRWLVLVRVGWIAVIVTMVILNLIALPDTYVAYFTFTPQLLQGCAIRFFATSPRGGGGRVPHITIPPVVCLRAVGYHPYWLVHTESGRQHT